MDRLWELTAIKVGEPVAEVDPGELSVSISRINDYPAIIFRMPTPEAVTEAYFVAVIYTGGPEREASQTQFRYFTLEYGMNLNVRNFTMSPGTVMCEWTEDAHHNYGDSPAATINDFIIAVERRI